MLNNISWGTYFTAVLIVLAIYEAAIALLFYRTEVAALLQRRSLQAGKHTNDIVKTEVSAADGEILDSIDAVVADLRSIIGKAGKETSKNELLSKLCERVKNYPGLRHRVFRNAINNDIISQVKDVCGLTFTREELNRQWQQLPVSAGLQ